jgi:serine/threonine protein kinase
MTPERWQKVQELFEAAIVQPPEERAVFVRQACAGDESLRQEVENLLVSDSAGRTVFESAASDVAAGWVSEQQSSKLIGQRIEHYEVLALLASGGMGEVYLARDTNLDRKVALKLLPRQFTRNPDRLRRFEQEAHSASALNHPNIITIYEIGTWEETQFLATEFIDGETLRELMNKRRLDLPEILDIAVQAAGALSAAHTAEIVHRDIKPANIMVRTDGYVKVLDFGLAKLMTAKAGPDVTDPGRVMGTVSYMSPEQALGERLDHRTDIFSFGAVLYEMATGSRAFEGESDAAVYDAILHKAPAPMSRSDRIVPPELDRIVRRAFEKDREQRYQAISDLRTDLKRLAQGSSPTAAALIPGQKQAAPKWQKDRRRWLNWRRTAVGLFIVAAIGGLWLWRVPNKSIAAGEKSIAVLPFQNLSQNLDNAYFTTGIQDEILARLSKIASLKVISRTSTQKYQSAPQNLRDIGKQLGVAHVLEGSVQRVANSVHINVQLIRVATDEHVWAESYNRNLDDIFDVEGDVAGAIAEALDARLTGAEEKALAAKPTQNAAAYDAYLRGLSAETADYDYPGHVAAAAHYMKAVQLDPKFALAWARLGIVRSFLYFNGVDPKANSPAAVKDAADQAFRLQTDLAEAWIARGIYRYRVLRDFSGAVQAYEEARKRLPNGAEVFGEMAAVERRLGRWEAAEIHYRRALELDPRNLDTLVAMAAEFFLALRRFPEAHAMLDRTLQIAPGDQNALAAHAFLFQHEGRLDEAAKQLARIPADSNGEFVITTRILQSMYERRFDTAITQIQTYIAPANSAESLGSATQVLLMYLGYCQEWAGRPDEARATFARTIQAIKPSPDSIIPIDSQILRCCLALAYAGLGDKEKALAEARRAVAEYDNDALLKPAVEAVLVQIQARFGDLDTAISALPHLLETPGGSTRGDLRTIPFWDPLRKDPRFKELCDEHMK